jgi:hypothetical protein
LFAPFQSNNASGRRKRCSSAEADDAVASASIGDAFAAFDAFLKELTPAR